MVDEDDLGLSLSLSCSKTSTINHNKSSMKKNSHSPLHFSLMPSLLSSLCSNVGDRASEEACKEVGGSKVVGGEEEEGGVSSANSTMSCLSGKRSEREGSGGELEDEDGEGVRKKLRLSKEQSAVLEDSFKENHTLNPKQKVGLAQRLGLSPRQVEVWFQNRRARTKLKQTEMDCELMKKWCEQLTEENRRLQKEVQELRALKKMSPKYYMQMAPPTTLTMCPECQQRRSPWGAPVAHVQPVHP